MSEFHARRNALWAEFPKESAYYESEFNELQSRLERAVHVLLPLALSAIESTGQFLATQEAIRDFLRPAVREIVQP